MEWQALSEWLLFNHKLFNKGMDSSPVKNEQLQSSPKLLTNPYKQKTDAAKVESAQPQDTQHTVQNDGSLLS